MSAGAPVIGAAGDSPRRDRVPIHGWARRALDSRASLLAAVAVGALALGGGLHLAGAASAGEVVWGAAIVLLAATLAGEVVWTLLVRRHMGVDTIALVAMVGALALGEELAGLIVGIMFTGGATIEELASARARRELTALIQRAPKVATRRRADGQLEEVGIERVGVGDTLLVRTGEVVPVDGEVLSPDAVLDTSTLTGEPLPVTVTRGGLVLSGVSNAGAPIDVRARRSASESAYSALVRLVEAAQSRRAPFVRMADRYAGFFLPATLIFAAAAWVLSGDPARALAVVVVATPCPLILAAPIALVCGLSRGARAGIIVKGAPVIEALGQARTVLFDKTGTLTVGTPEVRDVIACEPVGGGEVLRLAASVDQMSAHVLAGAIVAAAEQAELTLSAPSDVHEQPGQGIAAVVDGRHVAVGSRSFLATTGITERELDTAALLGGRGSGEAQVLVAVDGHLAGVVVMADEVRPEAAGIVARLRAEGVRHVAIVTGDRRSVAERLGGRLGVDRVYAEQTPAEKLEVVKSLRREPSLCPVVMVGDGVNDAPALALADVGIAMGAAGATVSSETADAVITVDRIDRVADALHIGRRALGIARQSVLVGMGLSLLAMAVAAAGYLPPVAGALLQEGIDLAVILNALRALAG